MDGPPKHLQANVVESRGAHLVALEGELDMAGASFAFAALTEIAGPTVTVDLARLHFMDVAGLRALVQAKEHLEAAGRALRVVNARGIVLRLIEAAGQSAYLLGR